MRKLFIIISIVLIFSVSKSFAYEVYENNGFKIDNSEIKVYNISIVKKEKYKKEDIELLIKLVHSESGSSWLTDEHQQLTAAVVLNRVLSKNYPNSIPEVIFQKGQYSCVNGNQWNVKPEQRTIDNVYKVLNEEIIYPQDIIYQSEFKQGNKVYESFYNSYSLTTTYFCSE